MSYAPYGWATQCAAGKARNATRKAIMRGSDPRNRKADAPPKIGWEFQFMGLSGTRGRKRMEASMRRLQEKGGLISS
jgi:hypothetical protein